MDEAAYLPAEGPYSEAWRGAPGLPHQNRRRQGTPISRGALYRHLAELELKEAYEQLRAAAIADATDSLQTVAEQAVSVLHDIANDPGVVPNVRVSAASKILDTAIKAHELQDVLTRLEALETEMA